MTSKIIKTALSLSVLTSSLLADSTLNERSTRLDSMELNNYMTKDGFNIFFNPANVATAQTGAFVELGLKSNGGANTDNGADGLSNDPNGMVGAIINGGSIGNFGIVLNRANNIGTDFGIPAATIQNNIDAFYAVALSDDFNLGLRLTYANLKNSGSSSSSYQRVLTSETTYNDTNTTDSSTSYDKMATDITLELGVQFAGLDATVTYGVYDFENSTTGANLFHGKTTTYGSVGLSSNIANITTQNDIGTLSADGASLLEFALSYSFDLDEDSNLITYGIYSSADYSTSGKNLLNRTDSDYDSATIDNTKLNETLTNATTLIANTHTIDTMVIGTSYNLKPSINVLLVVAGEYTNRKTEKTYSQNVTVNNSVTNIFNISPNTSTTINGTTGEQTLGSPNSSVTENDLSVAIAAEVYVTDSLALRFGVRESVYNNVDTGDSNVTNGVTYTNDDAQTTGTSTSTATSNTVQDNTIKIDSTENYQPEMQIAIGFGYQATKEVSIDGLVNADLFLTGPNFLSGKKLENLNARLALNYNF